MITVWGEGRGFRVVWLLEEMGLPYRLRDVDLLAGAENDPEFMAINPAGFIPALEDGAVVMVESVAIMQYLTTRYGPTPLAPGPSSPDYARYLQFLHLGEAGLAGSIYFYQNALRLPDEADRNNPTARHTLYQFRSRLGLVTRQLEKTPYVAGDSFTAADISVHFGLEQAVYGAGEDLEPASRSYMERLSERDGYRRAMEACKARAGFIRSVRGH